MISRSGIFYLLLLLPLFAVGQKKEYLLTGVASIKNGPTCKYNVLFRLNGNNITGNSVTIQPDGRQLKAMVNGTINAKRHTLTFRESKLPLTQADENNCMFNVSLTYKVADGNYLFSGTFVGVGGSNDFCDQGTVRMEMKKEPAAIAFDPPKPKPKPKPVVQAVVSPTTEDEEADLPIEFDKITATIRKEFVWHSDTCTMDIWDGEVVDGDSVTIKINGQEALTSYMLVANKKRIVLPLPNKTNVITVFAENEGMAPPNTSMILLTDGKLQHGVLSCIKKGETAEVIIRKGAPLHKTH